MDFTLLEKLCNANGVSSDESEIASIVKETAKDYCDDIKTDTMGNVICYKKGTGNDKKRIMLSAHMDEVGLMVTHITSDGYLKFDSVGGIDSRVLVSKAVKVGKKGINGVIGVKPAHLSKSDDSVLKIKDLYIDIGAQNKEEAEKYVEIGDFCCFSTLYEEFGKESIKAKALDDRVGCFVLLNLMKNTYHDDIYFSFVVQEEVGCRGAGCVAYEIKPDIAIVIEGTTCSDVPGTDEFGFSTHFGEGAAISLMDRSSIADKELVKALVKSATDSNVKWQYKQTTMGGNDAGVIHTTAGGIKTAVISVPCRYIHSPTSVANKRDIDSMAEILNSFLN